MGLADGTPGYVRRMRLLDHLKSTGLSAGDARRALKAGKVFLQGVPTADEGRDIDPANVRVVLDAPRITPGRDLAIVYRDEHLAIVWKPAGLLSVSASGRADEPNVIGVAERILRGAFVVHRLDEDTSGLMMVARDERTQGALKGLLEEHAVERGYLALASGQVALEERTVEIPLVRDRGDGRRGPGDPDDPTARRAVTHVRGIEHLPGHTSLLSARLETGRTHQVRLHLEALGHPVLGDTLYANNDIARRAPRLALHAAVLGFVHPHTGQQLRFEAPLADDLERLVRSLRRPPPPGKRQR